MIEFLPEVITILFGLLFGSFLNVCIYRIPRGESIAFPASHCPHCQHPIKPYDNVPVFSFLLLRGKCRSCGAAISWRYPLVEALTGALFGYVVHRYSFTGAALAYLVFTALLIAISFIDLDHLLIPDVLSLPGIALGFGASFLIPRPWHDSVIGMLLGGGMILAVGEAGERLFKKEAMGGGDVKLMAMIGAFLGWKMVLLTIFFASVVGAVIGIAMKARTGKEYIPFGPFLSLGALGALFFGENFLQWYLTFFLPSG